MAETAKVGTAPGALPVLGHALQLRGRPLEFLASLPAHGDLVKIWLGPKPAYVPCHPDLVQRVLGDSRTFDKGGPFFDKIRKYLGYGLATSSYEPHRRQRRLVQPAFHHARLQRYAAVMAEEITAAMEPWREGQVIDVDEAMYEISARIAGRTMFAADVGEEAVAEVRRSLAIITSGVFKRVTAPLGLMEKLPTPEKRRYWGAIARFDEVVDHMIAEYRRSGVDHGDLLSMLLEARDEQGDALSDEEVHEQVAVLFGAGTETSAVALAWAFHLLGRHPDIEERLHAEVDDVLGGRTAGWDDVAKLELTDRVITETLRLYPPGWMFTRVTTAEVELAGQVIPEGAVILFSPYIVQHREDIFEDAERFKPDRWHPDRAATLPRGAIVPFGGGARKCIGDVFAMTETTMALATIAGRWQFQPIPGVETRPLARATLHPNPLTMRLHRRGPH